jgi:hypothetical protein
VTRDDFPTWQRAFYADALPPAPAKPGPLARAWTHLRAALRHTLTRTR